MSTPKWIRWLLQRLAGSESADDVLGDLEERHRRRVGKLGRTLGGLLTMLESLDLARALLLGRVKRGRDPSRTANPPGRPVAATRRWLGVSWLDVKLGIRMLVKYPGMTVVAVFALAIGIPVGLTPLHVWSAITAPVPFDEPDGIQMLRNFNLETSRAEAPSPYDFAHWREELRSFETLGAATRGSSDNVISEDGAAAPVAGTEVTATVFEILRVRPFLGRTLSSPRECERVKHMHQSGCNG